MANVPLFKSLASFARFAVDLSRMPPLLLERVRGGALVMRLVFYGPPAERSGAVFGHKPINSRVQRDLAALSRQEALGGHLTRVSGHKYALERSTLSRSLLRSTPYRARRGFACQRFSPFCFSRVRCRFSRDPAPYLARER